jgi:16S rRNA U1498 N3-methylase RsmE
LPEIKVFKQISEINWKKAILNFDGINYKKSNLKNINFIVIGPEWWLTEKDINNINPELSISLWDKILRAETASILWWFILK